MKNKKTTSILAILSALIILSGCGIPLPLLNADSELNELSQKMIQYCLDDKLEEGDTDLSPTVLGLIAVMDEVYEGELTVQTSESPRKYIDTGLQLEGYPEEYGVAGGIVGSSLGVSIDKYLTAMFWDDLLEVLTDPQRYLEYDRTYAKGNKGDFLSDAINYVETLNHQIDVGQRDIHFEYDTKMSFRRMTKADNASFPEEGTIVICNRMLEPVTYPVYNAYMTYLYSFYVIHPVSNDRFYKLCGTYIKAGGGLWIFGAEANSGNVGQGILDEENSYMNWIESHDWS